MRTPPRSAAQPSLAIIVDTEEEFDWRRPFSREQQSTSAIPAQTAAHAIYDALEIVPTYVVGYPVAKDPAAVRLFGDLKRQARAEIGTHLHPWVTPPHDEPVTQRNSYHCNLAPELERAKIKKLTDTIEDAFGERPRIFKAGRYGFGPNTQKVLTELGYKIDCSVVSHMSFTADGGPDFCGLPDQPFWLDEARQLLEIPLTNGYFGPLAGLGPYIGPIFDNTLCQRLRLPGLLARSRLLERSRLSPEGIAASEQCRLLKALVGRGLTTFTLAYHSPSLAPGHTPYVRTKADLDAFLANIETVLRYFRDEIGGRFTTLSQIHDDCVAQQSSPAIAPRPIETAVLTH